MTLSDKARQHMPSSTPRSDVIIKLAESIIKDTESEEKNLSSVILKASRLARILQDSESFDWIYCEQFGYDLSQEKNHKYMSVMGRWTDHSKREGYVGSIAVQEDCLKSMIIRRDVIKNFVPSGQYSLMQLQDQLKKVSETEVQIVRYSTIINRVRSLVQGYASKILYEKQFSRQAETIFNSYQSQIDTIIAKKAYKSNELMPAAFERLSSGDMDSVRHALSTCRKVIDDFTDEVFPPRSEKYFIGQEGIDVTHHHVRNRLRAYIHSCIGSGSRYDKMRKSMTHLYDRVSTGVHDVIEVDEARALLLETYLFLGEIINLKNPVLNTAS